MGLPFAAPDPAPAEGAPEEDMGWGEDDTVAPAEDPAPPSDPVAPAAGTTAPPPVSGMSPDGTVAGMSATGAIEKKPAPKPDRKQGIGLMVAAGAVGAVAWGMAGARIAMINRCVTTDQDVSSALTCVTEVPAYLGLTVLIWLANDTTYGLGPAAGMVRGRYEASEYAYSGKYDRKGTIWAATGGAIMGVGIIGKITSWALGFKVLNCPAGTVEEIEMLDDCLRKRLIGINLAHQFSSTMIAGGAGALAFGIYYNKERDAREKLFFRPQQVRLTPWGDFSIRSNAALGMSLTGRF